MKNKNKLKWIVGIIVLALVVFLIFRLTSKSEIKGESIEVKQGDIATYYSFAGSIESKNRKTIFAEAPLQISEFLVKEGDKVKKDEILYKTTIGTEVKSPLEGEVLKIGVEENAQVSPGSEIIEIVDYTDLELKVKVDEYDLNSIEVGTQVDVSVNAIDKTFKGEVVSISKEGIYTNGVTFFETVISVENDENIKVGMSAEANVLNEESKDTKILPMKAIMFRNDNTPFVKIKNEKEIEEKEIELGITDGVNVEIKSGLEVGDKVFIVTTEQSNFGPPEGVREREEFNSDRDDLKEDNNE